MKETGLMFKAPLVRAILSGQKTQTRRLLKKQPEADQRPGICVTESGWHYALDKNPDSDAMRNSWKNPRPIRWDPHLGQLGDRIYVRETFSHFERNERFKEGCKCFYRADGESVELSPWRPAIHMPKHAARIWLEITGVRVERLQLITDADALAEGVDRTNTSIPGYARERFKTLWESTGGDWDANPWVWVIDFKRIEKP